MASRQTRILLPWFERMEAVAALFGFRVPTPGDDVQSAEMLYDAQLEALRARAPFEESSAVAGPLPPEIAEDGQRAVAVYEAALSESARGTLDSAVIDLTRVLCIQKFVWLGDALASDVTANDWRALAALCLPLHQPENGDFDGVFDPDGRGLTLSSLNPNLRAGPMQNVKMTVASGDRVIGFPIVFGLPFVHVIAFENRFFLKDGYHRTHALLAQGITHVPAVIETAHTFAQVNAASAMPPESLFGPHPARLTDFFDPSVSVTVDRQAFRKIVRIRAEEFVVNY